MSVGRNGAIRNMIAKYHINKTLGYCCYLSCYRLTSHRDTMAMLHTKNVLLLKVCLIAWHLEIIWAR